MTNDDAPSQPTESNSNEKNGSKLKRTRKRRFIGFSEQLEEKRKAREDKPRSWLEIKLVVPFVFAIAGYAWYVYVGRFCVPMLRREEGAMGGRGIGVAFTIVYCFIGLMFWWSYIKLVLTPPGFAREYVQNTPAPQIDYPRGHGRTQPSASRRGYEYDTEDWDSDEDFIGGAPYAEIFSPPSGPLTNEDFSSQQPPVDVEKQAGLSVPAAPHRPPAPVARTDKMSRRKPSDSRSPVKVTDAREQMHIRSLSGGERNTDETAVTVSGETNKDGAPPHPLAKEAAQSILPSAHEQRPPPPSSARSVEEGLPPPQYSRRPPTHPVLLPEFRYCYKDGLVKPMRAHHCRICGTCVLMYDHHCPWIGGCVGAHNHKFFVNFLQWSTLWLYWIFATLVGLTAKIASNSSLDIDPQIIVIIALSGFFSIFTTVLLLAHIHMINLNQTSVESVGISHMRERERAMLGQMISLWEWRRRDKIRKEWNTEWGELSTEGNIWWLGSARENWEHRMGRNRWGWFLPIGKSEGDGLTYPTNPRFDADGRWRRRNEWPAELR